ncbi:isochorismatase family cysteine hydrolase [Streptomyces sp. TG1A-8]|uniref:isochorismatase family cysteine hydrolase n=1 Tax=Streptomyces sp. TG1A-8 TaxID=3051385 RepID=UPI00265BAC21|nr:isochorismatase family cysteine hydrolase [Streptomyces sp. TG1A-8]MDO0929510.1 isochorismatase family cysteine hydrolase [Streptomyces sp. TG1A-8]
MSRYAILTNDLQRDLVDKNPQRKANVERMTPHFVRFLAELRELHVPVIHLQLVYDVGDKKVELHDGRIPVLRGTEGAELLPEFVHPSDVVMEKKKDSGFFETKLHEFLQEHGVDTVIITGMQAQVCIQTTAADAHFRGYNVVVPSDGVVSTRDEDRARALEWLASYCAVILPMADVVTRVREGAGFDFSVPALP